MAKQVVAQKKISPAKRRAILVLGMHRSGTSALSGVASALSGSAPLNLAAPNIFNPRGYWESQPLMDANNELLAAAGSFWDDWRQFNSEWYQSKEAQCFSDRIKQILASEYGDQPLFVLKDPRICRLVPFFVSILRDMDVEPAVLFAVRNPLEVAQSLQARDGFSISKSILLWLRHVLDAEFYSRNLPRCFVAYDDLLADWRSQMKRAAEQIGVIWPADNQISSAEIERFLSPDLRRQRSGPQDFEQHGDIASLAHEVQHVFMEMSYDRHGEEFYTQLDGLRARFNESCDLFGAIVKEVGLAAASVATERHASHVQVAVDLPSEQERSEQFEMRLATQQLELEQLQFHLETHREQLDLLQSRFAGMQRERNKLQSQLAGEQEKARRLDSQLAGEQEKTRRLDSQLAGEQEKTRRLDSQLAGLKSSFQNLQSNTGAELESKNAELDKLRENLGNANAAAASLKDTLDQITKSTVWRASGPIRAVGAKMSPRARRLVRDFLRFGFRVASRYWTTGQGMRAALLGARGRRFEFRDSTSQTASIENARPGLVEPYDVWVKDFDTLSDVDRAGIRARVEKLDYRPVISIIMPVYETPEWVLREAIDSVRNQLYPHWELCIADDASRTPHTVEVIQALAAVEPRIKWMRRDRNGNISAASNSALTLASGEFVALMDHDDLLPQNALYEVVVALNKNPAYDIIYSDEDQIDAGGRRSMPYFKTDWNIDLVLAHNMISHLGVFRRSLLERAGGFREGYEGSQDYDLALRCADLTSPERICHIPAVLYHWRREYGTTSFSEAKLAQCADAARRAISDHLVRRRQPATVAPHPVLPQWTRVVRSVPDPAPLVSLIVPTRDRADLLGKCVDGILRRTDYPNIEVLIVNHQSVLPETFKLFERLKTDSRVQIIPYVGEYNYSAINNMAVGKAKGSIIGLVNNDIDVIDPKWLSEMVSLAMLEDVGAVGAKLLYPDGRVQHGGIVLGVGGVANHFNHMARGSDVGYFGRNVLASTVSAVTGACLIVRKSVFEEVGGLNEIDLPVAFNDVDFCLRLGKKGYRNVWTPHAELYHHESASRGSDDTPEKSARFDREVRYMLDTWAPELRHDPFYSDNFSTDMGNSFQLAFPPRRRKTWLEAS